MTPPRVLFTCWPLVGHVHSQMGIAAALRERGSEVAFYSGEAARPTVEAAGYEMFAFDRLDQERAFRTMRGAEARVDPRSRRPAIPDVRALQDWLVETIPDQVTDLCAVFERWRPDVVATDLTMWAPIVVLWETSGVPVAVSSTLMGTMIPGPDAPPWGGAPPPRSRPARLRARLLTGVTDIAARGMRRRVDELRADHGLAPLRCSVNAFTGRLPLYLVGSLPELDYDRRDLPDSVHYVGSCTWHPPVEPNTAAWLQNVPTDDPWVHVTEGTLSHGDPFVLRAAARGLGDTRKQAILTTGPQRSPDEIDLGVLAPNVHLASWVNHDELLPRCAALVTTGGAATVISSLEAGVPVVVVPTTWDKPDNARRVVEAGVGIRLRPRDCTPANLRAAVDRLLEDSRLQDNARRIAARLAEAPGPSRAAELLTSLASASRSPNSHEPRLEPPDAQQLEGSRRP